jgi:deazaflavin-dependent oxidoreductase (nitroreductase family)
MPDPSPASLGALVERESRRRRFGVLLGRLLGVPVIGPILARLARMPNRLPGSSRITRLHAWLLRRSGGRLQRSWVFAAGQPVLSLTTTGRKSGVPRSTAVACFAAGDELAIAGMNLGLARDPAWSFNLDANPEATIELRGEEIPVTARRPQGEEAAILWRRWVVLQPSAPAFQELAGREIPLFVLRSRSRGRAPERAPLGDSVG